PWYHPRPAMAEIPPSAAAVRGAAARRAGLAAAGLAALFLLLFCGHVTVLEPPPALSRTVAVAALLATAGWAGLRVAARTRAHGASGLVLPALLALALVVRFTGLTHEIEGRYYADEGTYYHHASGIEAGEPLRLSFTYPHLLYYLDAVAL